MTTDDDNAERPHTPRRGRGRTPHATPSHARKASAPGATSSKPRRESTATGARPRSATMRQPPPSLLTDFLLGRQSPARIAADKEAARQRRLELEQVKQEMREGAIRRVQAPGGVHDRVKQWQKKNGAAAAAADPFAAPSEPSELNIQVEEESVTEEDRNRLASRPKKPKPPPVVVLGQGSEDTEKENQEDPRSGSPPKKRVVSDTNWMKGQRSRSPKKRDSSGSPLPKGFLARPAPKPAVKNRIKDWAEQVELPEPPRVKRYSVSKSTGSGSSDGIRVKGDVGERSDNIIVVETENGKRRHSKEVVSDEARPTSTHKKSSSDRASRRRSDELSLPDDGKGGQPEKSRLPDRGKGSQSDRPSDKLPDKSPLPTQEEGARSDKSSDKLPDKSTLPDHRKGVRSNKSPLPDDGIRIRPSKSPLPDDGIRIRPLKSPQPESRKGGRPDKPLQPENGRGSRRDKSPLPDDGIRIRPGNSPRAENEKGGRPNKSPLPGDGSKVRSGKSPRPENGTRERLNKPSTPDDGEKRRGGKSPLPEDGSKEPRKMSPMPDDGIRVYSGKARSSDSASTIRGPAKTSARHESAREKIEAIEDDETDTPDTPTRRSSRKQPPKSKGKSPARGCPDTGTAVTSDLSDDETWTSGSDASDAASDGPSSLPSKLAEIPVGYSAFSELNLPLGSQPKRSDSKNKRNPSFKGATTVLKKAFTEGRKIITEKVVEPPPKPPTNQPRSIESWLNKTVDPFVETPAPNSAPVEPSRKSSEKKAEKMTENATEKITPDVSRNKSPERAAPAVAKDKSPEKTASDVPKRIPSEKVVQDEPNRKPTDRAVHDGPRRRSTEKVLRDDTKARLMNSGVKCKSADDVRPTTASSADDALLRNEDIELSKEPPKSSTPDPTSAGLRRSRATRSTSSPMRASVRKGFRDKLMDAFRGESSGPKYPPVEYQSYEEHVQEHLDVDSHHDDYHQGSRRSSSSKSSYTEDDLSSLPEEPARHSSHTKRRPPTHGTHELSTIMSMESESTRDSDVSSVLSESTITQTTLTKSSGTTLSRHRSNKHGLKRRLTKHSDLVSVLSLPDESAKLGRSNSLKSTRSVHRTSNRLHSATVQGLLKEFAADENLYQRELKTLVDGVIPVLLTQVVYGNEATTRKSSNSPSSRSKDDALAKSVVDMGVALEKLRNLHRRCPLRDVHRLPQWLESVQSVYDSYLDAWRLEFQDLIVNLAPLSLDDNDSLVNALPRNEAGDVLNEDGERVDVAHLLKRPLVRVKWINKFIKGYRSVTGTDLYANLATDWDDLQEKARRRHKEESARAVDNDAINTDTSCARDLMTLQVINNVRIDRHRQVYAKDSFSLDLQHSNGQRLECQVELVFRDCQQFKSDPGDLLIRETGQYGKSWLLFPPVLGGQCSARKGDKEGQLVVMIRGKNDEWYEKMTLSTNIDEQVLDWLDILGTSPVPPRANKTEASGSQNLNLQARTNSADIPLGEKERRGASAAQTPAKGRSSHHERHKSTPMTPRPVSREEASSPWFEKTPTRESYHQPEAWSKIPSPRRDEDWSHPLHEGMRPDPAALRTNPTVDHVDFDEVPPPPPAHRSLPSKKPSTLAPPVELTPPSRVKRRGSSPLKHECHPSDISSEGSTSDSYSSSEYSDSESSEDELEVADMPETTPAISIKEPTEMSYETGVDTSFVSESTVSLPPSASASEVGHPQVYSERPEYVHTSNASISYWDNKNGCWRDLWPDVCSIVTTPGLVEAYPLASSGTGYQQGGERPLIALDLTPLVMIRNSTVLDLEIRSPVLSYARLYPKVAKVETSSFRFRSATYAECEALYMAVHRGRMDNAKYKALEEEARVRNFGQAQPAALEEDGSSRRRSWFGRKNSYRASARAPSQSAGTSTSHSSGVSASSFLKRLMGGGNQSFNIAMSSIDKFHRSASGGGASLYDTSSSGAPRSPSVSAAHSGSAAKMGLSTSSFKIRLHLLVSASKWEDHGNCYLEIARPDAGLRQNLRKYQGMEKRVIVLRYPKKAEAEKAEKKGGGGGEKARPVVVLDVVLGSRCFSRLGSRGILLNVWEEVKDERDAAGVAPQRGNSGGNVNKWCFQCASVMEASWIYGLATQEVMIG